MIKMQWLKIDQTSELDDVRLKNPIDAAIAGEQA
jgi:hypothetical protein